eukprot:3449160-Rhodomonas_salina.1
MCTLQHQQWLSAGAQGAERGVSAEAREGSAVSVESRTEKAEAEPPNIHARLPILPISGPPDRCLLEMGRQSAARRRQGGC